MPEFELITSEAGLKQLCKRLSGVRELAVDLEMDSLHHYREKVCLIQVSTRSANWLIDPLAINDLSPLATPLNNPEAVVVMHGADYDIRSLHRDFGIEINNLFDTMIASRFLGITEFGLAALLKARFAIELDKKYQKADWSRRPMSPEMCTYAVSDTAFLLPLFDQLSNELEEKKRISWFEEECSLVCQARVMEKEGALFMFCKGAGKLKGRNLAALEELLQLRDRHAREQDRPPFKVIPAELLIEIAGVMPSTMSELAGIKGMTPRLLSRYGYAIIAMQEAVSAVPEEALPRYPRQKREERTDAAKERLKTLKGWRDAKREELSLEPGILAPNWLLEGIADANPLAAGDFDYISGMRLWQKKLYGQELLKTLPLTITGS